MQYKRVLDLPALVAKKSVLLLGPRQTGKSTLLAQALPAAMNINLAAADVFRELSARPELIRQRLTPETKVLAIDEAQRIPELFDEIQLLLDKNRSLRVVLTGSSARKLRRKGINLLPGRIWKQDFFPLVFPELGGSRLTDRVIRGSLPNFIDNPEFRTELKNYVGLYLDEEVRAEGLVRGVGDFSRFLEIAALYSGSQVNFTNISNDTGVKLNTVRSYFEILEDTLIGFQLPAFRRTKSRKASATPKFYFFDCGVINALLNRFEVTPESELFGKALEHIVLTELRAYLAYRQLDAELHYWRSLSKIEVDFLIGSQVAIEVKSCERVSPRDEKGLLALGEDVRLRKKIIVCRERLPRRSDSGVDILPFEIFLERLWSGEIVS